MDEHEERSRQVLQSWIGSCTRGGKISRNTIAVGLVVIDHLRKQPQLERDQVISSGGEIKGARSGLRKILERYGLPHDFLKEITTRQAHQDGQRLFEAFDWGRVFGGLEANARDQVFLTLSALLVGYGQEWLRRKNFDIRLDHGQSPNVWAKQILDAAKGKSGGVVEQHLVGAKLQCRFHQLTVPNHPAHAADVQTGRDGDFVVRNLIYHVTATPSRRVIERCLENLRVGKHPILIVPADQEYRARALAQEDRIDAQITILSIESFVAVNVIELAIEENKTFIAVMQEIIALYNQRILEVETDFSLRIDMA
jgi:hypothetical protein